jgi:hypothetical protein
MGGVVVVVMGMVKWAKLGREAGAGEGIG